MLAYEFMRHALLAAAIVALVCGPVGTFVVLRRQAFAGHALGHIGFAGAAAALLAGVPPIWGLMLVTVSGGAAMGALGEGLAERDETTGVVLSAALGLGVLFLGLLTTGAAPATALLFGNVLGVDAANLWRMAGAGLLILCGLALLSRPLLFATLRPELAALRGVRLRLVSCLFLALVGLAVAEAVQVVGVLLVFTLLVGPAAASRRVSRRFWSGLGLSTIFALAQAVGGVILAYLTDWPASFWISTLSAVTYGVAFASAYP
jgi:zinc/manganese transport system permease protein